MSKQDKITGYKKNNLHEADLLILNDTLSLETVNLLKKTKPFNCKKIVVIIDEVVPANSPDVSKLHLALRELAFENDFEFIFGTSETLTYVLENTMKNDVVLSNKKSVLGVSGFQRIGIHLSEDELVDVYGSGKYTKIFKDPIGVDLKINCDYSALDINLSILKAFKDKDKNYNYVFNKKDLKSHDEFELSHLVLILNSLGFECCVSDESDFERTIEINLDLENAIAIGNGYENVVDVKSLADEKINAIFIGGATGGSAKNIKKFVEILNGRKVAYGVRVIITPNSVKAYNELANSKAISSLLDSGAIVVNTCALIPVQGRIGKSEIMLSTDWITEEGYGGFEDSKLWICSVETAAVAAVNGSLKHNTEENKVQEQKTVNKNIEGRVWTFGDDIDTDIIIPTQYVTLPVEEMAKHAFEPLDPTLAGKISCGDIIVAASNFGAGSSREMAAEVIANLGIKAIIAKSFARIFFRNAINNGILLIENDKLVEDISQGDVIEIKINEEILYNGKSYPINKIDENILEIIMDGGLVKNVEKRVLNNSL